MLEAAFPVVRGAEADIRRGRSVESQTSETPSLSRAQCSSSVMIRLTFPCLPHAGLQLPTVSNALRRVEPYLRGARRVRGTGLIACCASDRCSETDRCNGLDRSRPAHPQLAMNPNTAV